jgi:hypothetical protein
VQANGQSPDLSAIFQDADVRRPRNSLRHIRDIAAKSAANLAEDGEGQISFAAFDSAKVTPVQSTALGKTVLTKPHGLAFGLNPAPQS